MKRPCRRTIDVADGAFRRRQAGLEWRLMPTLRRAPAPQLIWGVGPKNEEAEESHHASMVL